MRFERSLLLALDTDSRVLYLVLRCKCAVVVPMAAAAMLLLATAQVSNVTSTAAVLFERSRRHQLLHTTL